MKYGFAGIFIIVLTLLALMGIYAILDGTIINEENHTGLKEAMEGAMVDAVDIEHYQRTGELKIIKEKFVENFTRRFVETARYGLNEYRLEFYDIMESPPKASVKIVTKSGKFKMTLDSSDELQYDIVNRLDAILKYDGVHLYTYDLYAFSNREAYEKHGNKVLGIYSFNIQMPQELKETYNIAENNVDEAKKRSICNIVNIEYVEAVPAIPENESEKARKTFIEKYKTWYWEPKMVGLFNNVNDVGNTGVKFCEIGIVKKFEFVHGEKPSANNDYLKDLDVVFKDNCKGNFVTGYKYRVTWECEQ